jgi:hypothetical protein
MKNGLSAHNCDQVKSMVYMALDGALSEQEMRNFLAELDRCSCCFKSYEAEKAFKQFLLSRIERKCMAADAQQRLRANLEKALFLQEGQ